MLVGNYLLEYANQLQQVSLTSGKYSERYLLETTLILQKGFVRIVFFESLLNVYRMWTSNAYRLKSNWIYLVGFYLWNGLIWWEKWQNRILFWFTFTLNQTKSNRLSLIIKRRLRKFACICEDFLFYSDTAHFKLLLRTVILNLSFYLRRK